MALFRPSRSKAVEQSAPTDAKLRLSFDAIMAELRANQSGLQTELRTMRLEITTLRVKFTALDDFRRALEAKSWMQLSRRRAGRVAAGVARAATGKRDARGRYLPS